MAKTIKFNLICDGNSVRTLEDLKNNFSIEDVLEYYKNGLLLRWLDVRGFEEEYEKVKGIREKDDIKIIKELIKIFDVESDDSKVEESVYILQYLKKRNTLLEKYEDKNHNLKNKLEEYIKEYNEFVDVIVNNKDDMPKIKAALKIIERDFFDIFELDHRNLFYKFEAKAPMAIFVMLTMDKMRPYYLFNENEEEQIAHVIETLENDDAIAHLQKRYEDKQEMFKLIMDKMYIGPLQRALGKHLKTFNGATDSYWKEIEPKGKKCMILKIDLRSFVRSSGTFGEELNKEDVNYNFLILDGIDYKSNSKTERLLYMEV